MTNITKIGLDWGTDNCCLSYIDDNNKINIFYDNNNHLISTIICIHNDIILIGNEINKSINYDISIISNLKRLIGIDINNNSNIIKYFNNLNISISYDNSNNDIVLLYNNKSYLLSQLIIYIMIYLKNIINTKFKDDNFETIITIPANFNEFQRRYILNCANNAKLNCSKIIHEPISACLTYLTINTNLITHHDDLNIIVFDFGAGTLDLALLSCSYDNGWLSEVISSIGDNELGGIDIDNVLLNWLINDYNDVYKILLERNENINKLIYDIKITLSNETDIDTSILYNICGFNIILNISTYYKLLDDHFSKRIDDLLLNLLKDNYYTVGTFGDIFGILLIGGSSKNNWIKYHLSKYDFKLLDQNIKVFINNDIKYFDIKDIGVSIGATDLSKYNNRELILLDTVTLSIGIEELNGFISKIINKNTIIPCSVTRDYLVIFDATGTFGDKDESNEINIKIYQGERELAKDNFFIGQFKFKPTFINKNIKTRIQITINIDNNNIISVTAKEWRTDNISNFIIETDKIKLPNDLIFDNINNFNIIDKKNKLLFNTYFDYITNIDRIDYNLFFTQKNNITTELFSFYIYQLLYSISIIYPYIHSIKSIINIDHLKLTNFINDIYNQYKLDYQITNDIQNIYDKLQDNNIFIDDLNVDKLIDIINDSKKILDTELSIFMIYYEHIKESNDNNDNNIKDNIKININTTELDDLIDILISSIENFEISDNKKMELFIYLNKEKECLDTMKYAIDNILTDDYVTMKINEINEFCEKLNS